MSNAGNPNRPHAGLFRQQGNPDSAFERALQSAFELMQHRNYVAARNILEPIHAKQPDRPRLIKLLAKCRVLTGDERGAFSLAERFRVLRQDNLPSRMLHADVLAQAEHFEDAEKVLRDAIDAFPENPGPVATLGELLHDVGRTDDAAALLDDAFAAFGSTPQLVHAFSRLAKSAKRVPDAIERLRPLVEHPDPQTPGLAALLFHMANMQHDQKNHEEAWRYYELANAQNPLPWDANQHSAQVDAAIRSVNRELIEQTATSGNEDDRMVFIVGVPRSGTSLTEQILASHPDVLPRGERPDIPVVAQQLARSIRARGGQEATSQEMAQAAQYYLNALIPQGNPAIRVTDKSTTNFLHLPMISRLLPNSRIVHCVRNPLDTGLSCYRQHFSGSFSWIYDQTSIGRFIRDERRLMEHFKQEIPLKIHTVVYEELVANPETSVRKLLDFVGLPFDERCLNPQDTERPVMTSSRDQVRKPLYTSGMGQFTPYIEQLRPMREALGDLLPEELRLGPEG